MRREKVKRHRCWFGVRSYSAFDKFFIALGGVILVIVIGDGGDVLVVLILDVPEQELCVD